MKHYILNHIKARQTIIAITLSFTVVSAFAGYAQRGYQEYERVIQENKMTECIQTKQAAYLEQENVDAYALARAVCEFSYVTSL